MGLPKRKRTSPPESPAPSKKRASEEEPELAIRAAEGEQPVAGEGQPRAPPPQPPPPADGKEDSQAPAEAAAARSVFEKDVDELQTRAQASVENVSHGQGATFRGRPPDSLEVDSVPAAPAIVHRIPSHAGWFRWTKIHTLERLALPEWFSGKNSQKTPETYMKQRNCMISKYRENTRRLLKLEDVQGSLSGDVSGAGRLFGFMDHWGIINYEAISDFSPFLPSAGSLTSVDEANNGALQLSPLVKPALANLFNFETALDHAPKLLSPGPGPPGSNLPLSGLAEAAVQESLAAPAVEYHCNSCQADCSKRRYHCQKQADFDLCLDCYSDGKFGQGMTSADFLRLDALTESADANCGGWSDQETLLLLEALELYGDNWTEIAEHVATKSKAQCILHFVCLPIEDPFLEDMEEPKSALTLEAPAADSPGKKAACPPKDAQDKAPESADTSHGEANGASLPSAPEPADSAALEKENEEKVSGTPTQESDAPTQKVEKESQGSRAPTKVEEPGPKHPLLAVAESTFCAGPDGLIAFADAGNPVMTQVAFLAAMVGPRVAAAAAQAALRSLSEDDPVGFLSARNSLMLNSSDKEVGGFGSKSPERLMQGNQSMPPAGDPASSDINTALVPADGVKQTDSLDKGLLSNPPGDGAAQDQKQDVNVSTTAVLAGQDAPSIAKVRNAAASALASAAVKAKLLADQEEREIQRLVAGVIENQLKKLELKLKHFNDLESMLGKECDQAEKARGKVYAERARIVASRLSPPSSGASQMQSAGSASASYPKPVTHPSSAGTQQRPGGFTYGPSGAPNPAAAYKQPPVPESSSQLLGGASIQQGLAQRLPRPSPGTNLTSGVK